VAAATGARRNPLSRCAARNGLPRRGNPGRDQSCTWMLWMG
jgi:hypothetical protein